MKTTLTCALAPSIPPQPTGTPLPSPPSQGPAFRDLFERIGRALDDGERLVERAISGSGAKDAASMVALQAGIYRYSEAVELTAKVVEHAAAGVRTVLQGSG